MEEIRDIYVLSHCAWSLGTGEALMYSLIRLRRSTGIFPHTFEEELLWFATGLGWIVAHSGLQ